jgi:hypothetical protein
MIPIADCEYERLARACIRAAAAVLEATTEPPHRPSLLNRAVVWRRGSSARTSSMPHLLVSPDPASDDLP